MAIAESASEFRTRRDETHRIAARRTEATRVERTLNEAFELSPFPPLRRVRARIEEDAVELHGVVRTYFQKQVAQQAAMDLLKDESASLHVINHVEVIG